MLLVVFFEKAVELDPKDAYACQRRSDLLYQVKQFEEALTICEQAIQLNPSEPDTYDTKSGILIALGRIDEAQDAHILARQLGHSE